MKTMLGWILDPCLHVITIALVFMHFVVTSSSEPAPPAAPEIESTYCAHCDSVHEGWSPVCRLGEVVDDLARRAGAGPRVALPSGARSLR